MGLLKELLKTYSRSETLKHDSFGRRQATAREIEEALDIDRLPFERQVDKYLPSDEDCRQKGDK